jgi:hypothetical protein
MRCCTMRRADPSARRAKPVAGATRWHAALRRAYFRLAQPSAPEYSSLQCRLHWKAWSHCR